MNRPKFPDIYINLAKALSERSTCSRLRVGAVITSPDFRYVYGIGYNANASGLPNQCDNPSTEGACGCLHAEMNAIINCNADRDKEKILFVTTFPCVMCAKSIINLGKVTSVYYLNEYRTDYARPLFRDAKISVIKIVV